MKSALFLSSEKNGGWKKRLRLLLFLVAVPSLILLYVPKWTAASRTGRRSRSGRWCRCSSLRHGSSESSVERSDFIVDPELHNPVLAQQSPAKVSKQQHDHTRDDAERSEQHQQKRPNCHDDGTQDVDYRYERRCYESLETKVFAHTDPSHSLAMFSSKYKFSKSKPCNQHDYRSREGSVKWKIPVLQRENAESISSVVLMLPPFP